VAGLLAGDGFALGMSTSRPTAGAWSAVRWARSWRAQGAGGLQWMGFGTEPRPGRSFFADSRVTVTWWRDMAHPDVAEIDVSAQFGEPPHPDVAEIVALCREVARGAGLAAGLLLAPDVPRGRRVRFTALETAAIQRGDRFGAAAVRRYLWGVGWAVWLTEGHLEALGGRARVLREAPVANVIESPEGLWLEASASPWDMPDAAWARLEAYLAPLLPTPDNAPALDRPPPAAAQEPPTESDRYSDYAGPSPPHPWLPSEGVDLAINVHLARRPRAAAARALARALEAWYAAGSQGAYPSGWGADSFHDLRGPDWQGRVARWNLDCGSADPEAAAEDLLRRLGGWSERWGCPITVVRLGTAEP
jgi:hypothetical protein